MAPFLTPEWIAEVNEAARAAAVASGPSVGPTLTLQQIVKGGVDDVQYAVRLRDGAVDVVMGLDAAADVTIIETRETAEAVSRGELSPQLAFMTGLIRVSGNVAVLMEHQSALHRLDAVFAGVRASTTY